MEQVIDRIKKFRVIPVVVLEDCESAGPLAKALTEGELPCAEVTFRTPAAAGAIRIMKEEYPDMLVGAGTVLTREQADEAIAAGAEFIVSPGLNPRIVTYCIEKGIPVIPGCANPSDIELALELGLTTVKFFPAEALGGIGMIKAMSAPYTMVQFMPTGGINEKNVRDYLACQNVIACGGSWMVKEGLVKEGKFEEITRLVKETVQLVKPE